MLSSIRRYSRWLHGRWPAGTVEKLPEVDERYRSSVSGLYIVVALHDNVLQRRFVLFFVLACFSV